MATNDLTSLENAVRARIGGNRLEHILSVRDECAYLAGLFGMGEPEKRDLCAAALLHDITKPVKAGDQIALAAELGVGLSEDDLGSPAILHALTGAALAGRDFAEYVNDAICESIAVHTTGKPDMSLSDKLLFLADYIEPLRPYDACRQVREFLYRDIEKLDISARIQRLNDALLLTFDLTIAHLMRRKEKIHPKTVLSRNFLL